MTYREALKECNAQYAKAWRDNNGYLRPIEEQLIVNRLLLNLRHASPDNPSKEDPCMMAPA
jgi:hypothetical protein